jgi:hypothetical protein
MAWLCSCLSSCATADIACLVKISRGLPGLADLLMNCGTHLCQHRQQHETFASLVHTGSATSADEHYQIVQAALANVMLQQQSPGVVASIAALAAFHLPCPMAVAQQIAQVLNSGAQETNQKVATEQKGSFMVGSSYVTCCTLSYGHHHAHILFLL